MKMSAVHRLPFVVPSIIGHPEFIWGPPGAAHRAPVTMRPMRRRESRLPLCILYRLPDRVSSALVESGLVARAFTARPGRASRVPSRLLGSEHDRMGVASRRAVGRRCGPADPPPWTRRSHRTHTQRRGRGPVASVPAGHPPVDSDESGGTRRLGSGLSLPGGVRLMPSHLASEYRLRAD